MSVDRLSEVKCVTKLLPRKLIQLGGYEIDGEFFWQEWDKFRETSVSERAFRPDVRMVKLLEQEGLIIKHPERVAWYKSERFDAQEVALLTKWWANPPPEGHFEPITDAARIEDARAPDAAAPGASSKRRDAQEATDDEELSVKQMVGNRQVHDYRVHRWGHGISIWDSKDKGYTATALGHGSDISVGDLLMVSRNGGEGACFYRVEAVEYKPNPTDMWEADLKFVPVQGSFNSIKECIQALREQHLSARDGEREVIGDE